MPIPPMIDDERVIFYQYDKYLHMGVGSVLNGPYTVDEVNEKNAGKVQKNLTRLNEAAEKKLDIAQASTNKVPKEVFDYIKEARKAHLPELIARVTEAHKVREDPEGKNKRGFAPHPTDAGIAIQQANINFARQVDNDVKEKYYANNPANLKHEILDEQVRQANREAGLEAAPSGSNKLFSNMKKAIYDEDKNGFQWGGIVGGVVGFGLSTLFGAGGILGTVIALVMTMIGVSLGNQVADNYKADVGPPVVPKEPKAPAAPAPAPGQDRSASPGAAQEQGTPAPEREAEIPSSPGMPEWVKLKKTPNIVKGDGKTFLMADQSDAELGSLNRQQLPAKPAQSPNKHQNTL